MRFTLALCTTKSLFEHLLHVITDTQESQCGPYQSLQREREPLPSTLARSKPSALDAVVVADIPCQVLNRVSPIIQPAIHVYGSIVIRASRIPFGSSVSRGQTTSQTRARDLGLCATYYRNVAVDFTWL